MSTIKSLKTLIRLRQRKIDELKREQAVLEGKRDGIIRRMQDLMDELQRELAASEEIPVLGTFFADFSDSIKQRQEKMKKEVLRVEKRIQRYAVEIQGEYSELKKLEISRDRQIEAQKKAEARKEQTELDDLGAERHRRRQLEEERVNA